MFGNRWEATKFRCQKARFARILDFLLERKFRFASIVWLKRDDKDITHKLANGTVEDQIAAARRLMTYTSPLCVTKLSLSTLTDIMRAIGLVALRIEWSCMHVELRDILLRVLANLTLNNNMCNAIIALIPHIMQPYANRTFLLNVSLEERNDIVMLVNNLYDKQPQKELHVDFQCLLQRFALQDIFACEILLNRHPRELDTILATHVSQEATPSQVAIYVLGRAFAQQHSWAKALILFQKILTDKRYSTWLEELRTVLTTHILCPSPNPRLLTQFLDMLMPTRSNLIIQSRFLTHTVIVAIATSRAVGTQIATLLSEWALSRTTECFDNLACDKERMTLLEQSMIQCDSSFCDDVWDALFYFWHNTLLLFHAQSSCSVFYVCALRVYHNMQQHQKATEKALFTFTKRNPNAMPWLREQFVNTMNSFV